jgi:RNA polymerase sigma-70 factor (ECF subfamily)
MGRALESGLTAEESAAPSNDEPTAPSREDSIHPERIRAGDPAALRAVVSAYLGQVLRAARGAGLTPEQAEDVTQATFSTFIERAPRFEGRSHVRTWLFGILYKKIAEKRRARDRDRRLDDIDQVFDARFDYDGGWALPPRPADADLEDQEIGDAISDCLDAAPTQQRMAFVLREVEGLSTEEICKILDVTVTNLGVIMYRIRNRLRECLEAKGIDPLRN